MKKSFWISLIAILVLGLATGCLQSKKVLNVGTDAAYEPFEAIDESGEFVGFDMELIKMVADEMEVELKLHNVGWDGIIPGLMNGNYDCLISAMTITEERQKQINFSDPYFSIKQAIVVREDNNTIHTPSDLMGKSIAVQIGTTGDLYASEIRNVTMKRYDTNPLAIQELLNNNVDAAVMDDLVAYNAIRKTSGLKVIEIAEAETEDYGIGVTKENIELLEKINQALTNLRNNGKLDELVQKYKSGN